MQWQRINRTNPEKIFIVAKNTYSTASLTNGQAVMWDYVTDRDGVGVTKPAASTVSCGFAAAGVVAETIAAGAYGLVQVYGYHSAVLQRATTGAALKTTHGTPMTLSLVANFSLEPMVTGYASTVVIKNQFPMAFSLGRVTTRTVTGVALAAFIRCL
jgi:hypothetical protein